MASKTLEIIITGNNAGAKKAFQGVDAAAGTTESKLRKMGDNISPAVAAAATAVVAGVGLALKSAWSAAEESAKIGRETERVLRTTGATAWTSADQVGELATSISELTGADDELIQSGANLLLTFTNIQNKAGEGNDVFDQATQLALDMSTALGTDMSSASIQLGKALNNPIKGITALSRAGVSFTEEQKAQIETMTQAGDVLGAQKIILAELSKEFGGAAEAAATPVDRLKVKLGNLQEDIGSALIPIVGRAADIVGAMTDAFSNLPGPIQTVVGVLAGGGAAGIGAVVAVSKLASMFGDTLKPVMSFARDLFDRVAISVGEMATKMGASQTMGANLASGLSSAVVPALGGVAAAATIGFGIWTMYQQGQAAADARAKEFTDTLDAETGAITENTTALVQKKLQEKDQLDNLSDAGISVARYTAALNDNSKAIALTNGELIGLATTQLASDRTNYIDKLRAEGGERNNLIALLAEQGQLDKGLAETIIEQINAYDHQQEVIKEKVRQQAIANGKTEEEANAAANAASANLRHADSLKEVAAELRAQTDPYFRAYRSAQQLQEAQDTYNKTVNDGNKSEREKRDAWIAVAQAAGAYKGDLLALDEAAKREGATTDALRGQLNNLAQFGLDTTGDAAVGAMGDLENLGTVAGEVGKAEVDIPVTADTGDAVAKLRDLAHKVVGIFRGMGESGMLGAINTRIADILEARFRAVGAYAQGGMVGDGMFVVGEQGPELGVKQGSSVRIFSNPDSRKMLSSAGGGSTYNIVVNVPPTADKAAVGKATVEAIKAFEQRDGARWRK